MNRKYKESAKQDYDCAVMIDAGVEFIKAECFKVNGDECSELLFGSVENAVNLNGFLSSKELNTYISKKTSRVFITGKLANSAASLLDDAVEIIPAAALWAGAKMAVKERAGCDDASLGVIDLSASGYTIVCVDHRGELVDDCLVKNPSCGAGCGENLMRILQKLNVDPEDVDGLLHEFSGIDGEEKRKLIPVRADRCGVFSSSATISDKNQGIPLTHALAVTMKSEVEKACDRFPERAGTVILTGGVFRWKFARECAEDSLKKKGAYRVRFDSEGLFYIDGLRYLAEKRGVSFSGKSRLVLNKATHPEPVPGFKLIHQQYLESRQFCRENEIAEPGFNGRVCEIPVSMAFDIGSTMAKMVMVNSQTGEILDRGAWSNHGDTIETVKQIFRDISCKHGNEFCIQNIGVTGSGRYQVQRVIECVYPHLKSRIHLLVENYAHARGSIKSAKEHIASLKENHGICLDESMCVIVDIGGEDTKISVVSLGHEELLDNAMNVKCSAGTGSLMDTLASLLNIISIKDAYMKAYNSETAFSIDATCAVFLMENARKMQAEGYPEDSILASCVHAIVENMARTLWDQVELPKNSLVLLHGQTMQSDPLPLAVTRRLQTYMKSDIFCLVPSSPGYRACIGLLETISKTEAGPVTDTCRLDHFINMEFEKKLIECRGAACGDKNARCYRTLLKGVIPGSGEKIAMRLGGCTAVNELEGKNLKAAKKHRNTYKNIWEYITGRMPFSENENRLVIPRSFAVSQQAYFLALLFEKIGIPVHVDSLREEDIMNGRKYFDIDVCAPCIGSTGQFIRLAGSSHGFILAPQIDFLSSENSLGRTCTTNQGGVVIACQNALKNYPESRFHFMTLNMKDTDPVKMGRELYPQCEKIFSHYKIDVSREKFYKAVEDSIADNARLFADTASLAAEYIEHAIDHQLSINLVCGREYILNPGIYDSHIGKLLSDKNIVAIPSYIFDVDSNETFSSIYWKNPHDIVSVIDAVSKKIFHRYVKDDKLRGLIKRIETGKTNSSLTTSLVATFRCGPDSVSIPLINEITKNVPSLLIQSDLMIAELAHLENRVNTHVNQVSGGLIREADYRGCKEFDFSVLSEMSTAGVNPETDVLYFPTMSDNRMIAAVFRAAGITTIDNYSNTSGSLESRGRRGRDFVGDSVCTPLSVVFSDILDALDDFHRRKKENDPLVKNKERVLVFMHGGDGPCRLGQYVNIFKLNLLNSFRSHYDEDKSSGFFPLYIMENLFSGLEGKKDYYIDIEPWTALQALQSIVIKGILHTLYFEASALCNDKEEYDRMCESLEECRQKLFEIFEYNTRPSLVKTAVVKMFKTYIRKAAPLSEYFCYGLYNNNGIRKVLREFSDVWIRKDHDPETKKLRIHVDGEVYMRVALAEGIHENLLSFLGFGSFKMTYTPVWCVFEIVLHERIRDAHRSIKLLEEEMKEKEGAGKRKNILETIKEKRKFIDSTAGSINTVRKIFIDPLYRAAGIGQPPVIEEVLACASTVIPTLKPVGELCAYVGEVIWKLEHGTDIVLNVLPEGCMVSSMGQSLTDSILRNVSSSQGRIQHLTSLNGEINDDVLKTVILKALGPEECFDK